MKEYMDKYENEIIEAIEKNKNKIYLHIIFKTLYEDYDIYISDTLFGHLNLADFLGYFGYRLKSDSD